MIDYQTLRKLVLETVKAKPLTQYSNLMTDVKSSAVTHNISFTENDEMNVNQIICDLIVDRVLTIGSNKSNQQWPHLRLTDFGHSVVDRAVPTYYDPEGYIAILESFTPKVDSVIKQYVLECLNCFKQHLFFAAAVMLGAAAEKAVLLLLESIGKAETDTKSKRNITELLERPSLPKIFSTIQSKLQQLIKAKTLPYSVHQGSTEHLLSLVEMIRVQRNDAIHPVAVRVNRTKVFLSIQSLPAALEVIYRLIKWFKKNRI